MSEFSPEKYENYKQWLANNPLSKLAAEKEAALRHNLHLEAGRYARGERPLETDLETDREPLARGHNFPWGELDKIGLEPERIPLAIEESEEVLDFLKEWINKGYISSRPGVTVLDEQVELTDMASYPGPQQRLNKIQCNKVLAAMDKLLEYKLVEPETEIFELPKIVEEGIAKLKRVAGGQK